MSDFDQQVLAAMAGAVISGNGWLRIDCPACVGRAGKADTRQSMGVRPDSGFCHCFKCGYRSRVRGTYAFNLPTVATERDTSEANNPPDGYEPLWEEPNRSAMCTADVRRYLIKRNVPEKVWRSVGVGVTLDGPHYGRIIVPIRTRLQSAWLGWVGRTWKGQSPLRYKYPAGMNRGEIMFNQDALLKDTPTPVVIVEGVFDALPHWPHAVACLGKPSRGQFPLLMKTARPILVALDGDAWREAEALMLKLRLHGKRAEFLKLPPKTDPGDLAPGSLIETARSMFT